MTRRPGTPGETLEGGKPDWRSDVVTKPPATVRRDDRAEPDDDEGSSPRIDIVNVDGGGGGARDTTASAVMSLRRELARLHQQASAVEKSLDDQRRDRGDALDRLERATERVLQLEARIATLEAESGSLRRMNETARSDLQRVHEERDDLARVVEMAKVSTAELSKVRDEADAAKDEIAKLEGELTELQLAQAESASRIAAKETALLDAVAKVGRATSELEDAKRDAERKEATVTGLRAELGEAREAAAKVRDEADRDRIAAREQIERLERLLAEAALDAGARVETERLRGELEKAQAAIADAETRAGDADARAKREGERTAESEERARQAEARATDATREAEARAAAADERAQQAEARAVEADLRAKQAEVVSAAAEERARHAELRGSAADERAKEADARAAAAGQRAAEADSRASDAGARESAAVSRATVMEIRVAAAESDAVAAEERVKDAEAAYASLERSLRRLRDEIAFAFERAGLVAPLASPEAGAPAAPEPAAPDAPPARAGSAPPGVATMLREPEIISIPPDMAQSLPPSAAPPPRPQGPPPLPEPAGLEALDAEWAVPSSGRSRPPESLAPTSPVSRSVPPPPPEQAPISLEEDALHLDPDDLTTSPGEDVSPPTRASARPAGAPRVPLPAGASVRPSVPDVSGSVPPAPPSGPPPLPARASVKRRISSVPAPVAPEPPVAASPGTIPPPTRRPSGSEQPAADPASREAVLAKLVDKSHAATAAAALRQRPDWLRSLPPPTLVAALSSVDYDAEGPVFEVARAWEREPLCHALVAQLKGEEDARLREHGAWLLKHLAAPASWKAISDLARSEDEPPPVRRWLLEALERLASGGAIGWRELGDLVTALCHDPDANIRDGVVGILVSLERSDEKRHLLLEILRTDDDEVVLASAVNALASVLPVELDPLVVERLLGHPSSRVQRSVRELVERAKREARS